MEHKHEEKQADMRRSLQRLVLRRYAADTLAIAQVAICVATWPVVLPLVVMSRLGDLAEKAGRAFIAPIQLYVLEPIDLKKRQFRAESENDIADRRVSESTETTKGKR